MPSINDALELANSLQTAGVSPIEQRCVAVRNRNSKCRACIEVCIGDAIEVHNNQIKISNGECVSCGACVAVCPTQALLPTDPDEETLYKDCLNSMEKLEGEVVIGCARIAARKIADPELYAVVPCMGRIDDALMVNLASAGASDIALVDGDCTTCKYHKVIPAIDATVMTSQNLLEAVGSDTTIRRMSEFPAKVSKDATKAIAASRRGFFTNTGTMVRDIAMQSAQKAIMERINPNANKNRKNETLRQRLSVVDTGKLPQFKAVRNMQILDAMYEMEEQFGGSAEEDVEMSFSPEDVLDTRLFGSFEVDTQKCTGCGMCVMFCPTGAISFSEYADPGPDLRYGEFSAADCTQCNLCADVCLPKAITISTVVPMEEIFDFEPRLVEFARASKKPNLFTGRRLT
ncbi:MAG: 4Fe-4S binding protein [Eggerthellaceae bacterium]|nr:4Fe-4S binding protein [Eggerthellaceae bacterium]